METNKNKISAFDLRIGNYILYSNNIYQVINLTRQQGKGKYTKFGSFYSVVIENQSNVEHAKINDLKPIVLTDEWLIKFGFEKIFCSEFSVRYELKKDVRFEISFNLVENYIIAIKSGDTLRKINYIHEMQNLYHAITGIELVVT